jgi:hypothetical protein
MTRGLIFWVLMLIWFVFGMLVAVAPGVLGGYTHIGIFGNTILLFILFLLLGWQVYGPPVRGG